MSDAKIEFTVFTKPWKDTPLADLAKRIKGLGFDGIELPVRPGYQVPPENVAKGLAEAAKIMADHGLKIASLAGPADEKTIVACREAGVPLIRIMAGIPRDADYLTAVEKYQREWDDLVPLLARWGVTLGIQNHCGRYIGSEMQIQHAIGRYNPKHVGCIWDAGHNGLMGREPEIGLDIVWSHLRMVNLKNARWVCAAPANGKVAQWKSEWVDGRGGMADWTRVAKDLQRRKYQGVICMTAEYSDPAVLEKLVAEDFKFARSLLA